MNVDYIIIGAGSSGSVLANRLSKDPKNSVLLLEAGGKPSFLSTIPGWYSLLNRGKMDWAFSTEPQKFVNDRKIYIPRGKSSHSAFRLFLPPAGQFHALSAR